jgi:hypothetical protein
MPHSALAARNTTSFGPPEPELIALTRNPVAAEPLGNVVKKRFDWTHYISLVGTEGKLWLERYRLSGGIELIQATERALVLLRRRSLGEARNILIEVDREVSSRDPDDSITHVMRRWYYAALAYELYCREDFGAATKALEHAHESVRMAVEASSFLLPLASHCCEFRLQHARIARTRRRWREMWDHIEAARAMLADRAPFCMLSDGTAIGYADFGAIYGRLDSYEVEDRRSLIAVFEAKYRLRSFERHLHWVYAPAGFVIPYTSLSDDGELS